MDAGRRLPLTLQCSPRLAQVGVAESMPSFYAPEGVWCTEAASEWDRGWIDPPRHWAMGCLPIGRPPAGEWHPGPHIDAYVKPGLVADRRLRGSKDVTGD